MTDREACILLNMISGIGFVRYQALSEAFGSPAKVFEQSEGELVNVPRIGPQLAQRIACASRELDLQGEIALAERSGVRILTLHDDAYPAVLRNLYDPPLALYVRGTLPEFGTGNALAIVGTRRVTRYGAEVTRTLAEAAAEAGMVIVSGLALGVDAIAHRAAVEASMPTVAVLGGGLARVQPQENIPLARGIIRTGGAVVSEFPMQFPVSRTSFPRRNRIVARLADAVLVTEAGADSGALITADLAGEYSLVMAVPGRVDNPQAAGCHKLLKNGATLVENFNDVANAMHLGLLPLCGEVHGPDVPYHADGLSDLPPDAVQVLAVLNDHEATFDELAAGTGMDAGRLSAALSILELMLQITRDASQVYRVRKI